MKVRTLSRRTVLRGAGGAAIALPFLEIMLGRKASAQAASPKRFMMMFAGALSGTQGSRTNYFVPNTNHTNSTALPEGAAWPLTPGLQALGTRGVKGDVTVVSRLLTPSGGEQGQARWRGTDQDWHSGACYAQISGCSVGPGDIGGGGVNFARGAGPDWLLAQLLEPNGDTRRILNLGAQPVPYGEGNANYATFTFKPSGTSFIPATNTVDPRAVWTLLFGSGTPGPPAPTKTAKDFETNVLDFVKDDATRLRARVGKADQQRLDQHLDEIRALQSRLAMAPPPMAPACMPPADPLGTYPAPRSQGTYSGELERARLMADLIHMAFVCDKSRVATLVLSNTQSQMNSAKLDASAPGDLHETNHGGQGLVNELAHAKCINWHVDHFAYLLAKMKASADGAGTLLDSVGALMFFEGGLGRHWTGSARGEFGSHNSEDVVVLVGGRAGGLKVGQHLIELKTNPACVTLSVMRALGHAGPLNEISAVVPRLLP